jgi:DNA-binding YbaB/EbfC family protein
MNQLMKQAKKMQEDLLLAQAALAEQRVEGTAGGGMVKVTLDGHKSIQSVLIDPSVVQPDDVEMLQDLIVAALQDAQQQVDVLTESSMGKYAKGMNVPGLF